MNNILRLKTIITLSLLVIPVPLMAGEKHHAMSPPHGAEAFIVTPKNGATVSSPVTVKFGLQGMIVAPAGSDKPNSGHHHLLINAEKMPEEGRPMGKDVKHFGGGQTEAKLDLPRGSHTLQLMLGDKNHVPFNPPVMSEKITITVK